MIVVRQGEPVQVHDAGVARVRAQGEADLRSALAAELRQAIHVPDDDVRPRDAARRRRAGNRLADLAVDDLRDLDRAHGRVDGEGPDDGPGGSGTPELGGEFLRDQHASRSHAERTFLGLVGVLMPFDVEEGEAGRRVADDEIERRTPGGLLDEEVPRRQAPGKSRGVQRNEAPPSRARVRATRR